MKVGEIWAIDWLDHFDQDSVQAWQKAADIDMVPPLHRTVGFVVKISHTAVALSTTYTPSDGMCSSISSILKPAIVATHRIKLPPLRRKKQEAKDA